MDTTDALALANKKELDLVEVSPNAQPPVCKIIDYGKHLYKIKQEQKKQKAKAKEIITKEIRMRINTGEHDLQFKAKNAKKFLLHGDKVKISLLMKGRERAHRDIAEEKIKKFIGMLEMPIIAEKGITKENRGISITVIKDKTKTYYEDKNENKQINSQENQNNRQEENDAKKTETESL